MSTLSEYVITWGQVRADGLVFAPGSIEQPEAIVGSVVSSHLNYHLPVGLVVEAVNDARGCRVAVQFDFGKGRDRSLELVPVFTTKRTTPTSSGHVLVTAAVLLHVSLGG